FLDQTQAKMDVAEQASLLSLPEGRRRAELSGPAEIVQERRCEQQIRTEPGMELGRLAADRGDPDRVLQEAARIAVVAVGGGGQGTERGAQGVVGEKASDGRLEPRMRDLARQELEEAVELVGVAAQGRGQLGGVG